MKTWMLLMLVISMMSLVMPGFCFFAAHTGRLVLRGQLGMEPEKWQQTEASSGHKGPHGDGIGAKKVYTKGGGNKGVRSRPNGFVPLKEIIAHGKKSGDWAEAVRVADDLLARSQRQHETKRNGAVKVSPFMITDFIRIYGESGNLGRAISLLYDMQTMGLTPNEHHFGALLQSCRRAHQWEMGLELFSRMEDMGIPRNVYHYNIIISALGDAHQADLALPLLRDMTRSGVMPDAYTFSAAITACDRSGMWAEARRLWDVMTAQESQARPNTITLNALLHSLCTGRQWQDALTVFEAYVLQSGPHRVRPDVITYSTAIQISGELGDLAGAEDLFACTGDAAGVGAVRRDVGLYNALITACERNGAWQRAVALVLQMEEDGFRPDEKSYSAAISCCGNCGMWSESLRLFHRMKAHGIVQDTITFNAIIGALQKGGQWDKAKDILIERDSESRGDIKVLSMAADVLYSQGVREGKLQHWSNRSTSIGDFDGVTMDLHGFPLPVARAAVGFVLDEMKTTGNVNALAIITGRGNHVNSSGTKRVLRADLVTHITQLQPQNVLQVSALLGNDGCIVVTEESICEWIAQSRQFES